MRGLLVRGLDRGISILGAILPAEQQSWANALRGEVAAAPLREKLSLATSGACGLVLIAAERVLLRWASQPIVLAAALSTGAAIGLVDVSSATRWPLRLCVVGGCLAIGAARPEAWVISGAIVGIAIAAVGRIVGAAGPYAYDAGDVWIPVIPAILVAAVGGAIGRRFRLRKAKPGR